MLCRALLLVGPMCAEYRCGSPVQRKARQLRRALKVRIWQKPGHCLPNTQRRQGWVGLGWAGSMCGGLWSLPRVGLREKFLPVECDALQARPKNTCRGRNNPSALSLTFTRRVKPPAPHPQFTRRRTPAAQRLGFILFGVCMVSRTRPTDHGRSKTA